MSHSHDLHPPVKPERVQDLTDQVFSRLTVKKFAGLSKHRQAVWECECQCGTTIKLIARSLVSGNTQSCGCLKRSRHIQENVKEQITAAYLSGISLPRVAALLHVSLWSIRCVLRNRGIPVRCKSDYDGKLTTTQREVICTRYQDGASTSELEKEFGVDKGNLWMMLKRRGIALRSPSEAQRIHLVNESAFDVVTEESAYWIGFLMADGCVHIRKQSHRLSLALALRDIGHIYKFRDFLGSDHPISTGVSNFGHSYCRLALASTKLTQALIKFGVTPRKTATAKVIGREQDRHFWRGVNDGDGSLFWAKEAHRVRPAFSLCGSRLLILQAIEFIATIIGYRPSMYNHHTTSFIKYVRVADSPAVHLVRHIYGNCQIALDRKMKIAQDIMALRAMSQRYTPPPG